MMKRPAPFKLLLFAAVIFLAGGCWNPFQPEQTPPKPGEEYKPRTSPENVLWDLVLAYERKDFDHYQTLFHKEYKFHFAKVDYERDPEIPPEWGYNEEMRSASKMFADPAVTISLTLFYVPGAVDTFGKIVKIPVDHPQLMFDIRDKVTYSVTDPQEFKFAPDPADSSLWLLYEWWDEGTLH